MLRKNMRKTLNSFTCSYIKIVIMLVRAFAHQNLQQSLQFGRRDAATKIVRTFWITVSFKPMRVSATGAKN